MKYFLISIIALAFTSCEHVHVTPDCSSHHIHASKRYDDSNSNKIYLPSDVGLILLRYNGTSVRGILKEPERAPKYAQITFTFLDSDGFTIFESELKTPPHSDCYEFSHSGCTHSHWNEIKDVKITYSHENYVPSTPIVEQKKLNTPYGPLKVRFEGSEVGRKGVVRCVFASPSQVPKESNITVSLVDEDGFSVVQVPVKTDENYAIVEVDGTEISYSKWARIAGALASANARDFLTEKEDRKIWMKAKHPTAFPFEAQIDVKM